MKRRFHVSGKGERMKAIGSRLQEIRFTSTRLARPARPAGPARQ